MSTDAPQERPATKAETGRVCPYCRFPLKEGIAMVQCGVCSAPHHADCWQDNGGCAVVACAGGPSADGPPAPVPPPPPPTTPTTRIAVPITPVSRPATGTAVPPPPPQPRAPRASTGPWLVAAVLLLALVIAGAAVAVVATQGQHDNGPVAATPGTDTGTATPAADTQGETVEQPVSDTTSDTATTAETPTSLLPDVSRSEMRSDIQDVLLRHHEAVVNGDYADAWEYLSKRKQRQYRSESGGYDGWVQHQEELNRYLDPAGLNVEIAELDRHTGVARVMVTGMTWSGRNCSEFSGYTWAKYEDGEWKYDPGYSTTSQRRRDWGSSPATQEQLIGWGC